MVKVKIFEDGKLARTMEGDMFAGVVGTEYEDHYNRTFCFDGRSSTRGTMYMMRALAGITRLLAKEATKLDDHITEKDFILAHMEALMEEKQWYK